MKEQTILVTGGAGYIGSAVVRRLLADGHRVRVVDILRFGSEGLREFAGDPRVELFETDVRDRAAIGPVVEGCDTVVHLAAIVGDPACRCEPELARSVNLEASIELYGLAEAHRCSRFVFSSTCSNYGRMDDHDALMTEESKLAPISLYAETKVGVERFLLGRPATNRCAPICLRFSTAYGLSPRMRFDLTVNEFTRELTLGRELLVYGEQFWRPYCHVEDLARAVGLVVNGRERVAFEVFNVGETAENYTKQMIVDELLRVLPASKVRYKTVDEDPRDYRVSSEKISRTLGFAVTRRVPDGIREIVRALRTGLIANPDDPKYSNV